MNIDELCALFDKKNPLSEELGWKFEFVHKRGSLVSIERKGVDLVEIVRKLADKRIYPVIDKKLRIVLGLEHGHHIFACEILFQYHYHADDPELERPHIGPFESQDRYVTDGYGYFISSMRPSAIVVGTKYRPDHFDKDLFLTYELDRI